MSKTFFQQGFLLKVVSWENDGDHRSTKMIHYLDKDNAKADQAFCNTLLSSKNTDGKGIGNTHEHDSNTNIATKIRQFLSDTDYPYFDDEPDDWVEDDDLVDHFMDVAYDLCGGSDFYKFRVVESVELFEVPEDVVLNYVS